MFGIGYWAVKDQCFWPLRFFNQDLYNYSFIPGAIAHQDAGMPMLWKLTAPFYLPWLCWCPSDCTESWQACIRFFLALWCVGGRGACDGHSQLLQRSLLKTQLFHKVHGRKRSDLVTNSLGSSANPSLGLAGRTPPRLSTLTSPHCPQALPWSTYGLLVQHRCHRSIES